MEDLNKINLQQKTTCLKGEVQSYWFENDFIGLKKTLFHRITIPLAPFDSGLDYEEQPLQTCILIDWIKLELTNPLELDGLNLNHVNYPETECSIYVGSAHNPCDINKLEIGKLSEDNYQINGELEIDFEHEGVALNESFTFNVIVDYVGEVK